MKKFLLCADDVGLHPLCNIAAVSLFQRKCLSMVSVLIDAPFVTPSDWKEYRKRGLQIGLHLNMTLSVGKQMYNVAPLWKWIFYTNCGFVNEIEIKFALEEQMNKFYYIFGHEPDFIDGHEHIHQLPIVRNILLDILQERYKENDQKPWIRITVRPPIGRKYFHDFSKCVLLEMLGGISLKMELSKKKWPHPLGFLGIYNFQNKMTVIKYRYLMKNWLSIVEKTPVISPLPILLMCHPAAGLLKNCQISMHRLNEYLYLNSDKFLEDMNLHDVYCC